MYLMGLNKADNQNNQGYVHVQQNLLTKEVENAINIKSLHLGKWFSTTYHTAGYETT